MSRYLANKGRASLADRISGTMLMVLSTGAVITLGSVIYLRKQGLIPGTPQTSSHLARRAASAELAPFAVHFTPV